MSEVRSRDYFGCRRFGGRLGGLICIGEEGGREEEEEEEEWPDDVVLWALTFKGGP